MRHRGIRRADKARMKRKSVKIWGTIKCRNARASEGLTKQERIAKGETEDATQTWTERPVQSEDHYR